MPPPPETPAMQPPDSPEPTTLKPPPVTPTGNLLAKQPEEMVIAEEATDQTKLRKTKTKTTDGNNEDTITEHEDDEETTPPTPKLPPPTTIHTTPPKTSDDDGDDDANPDPPVDFIDAAWAEHRSDTTLLHKEKQQALADAWGFATAENFRAGVQAQRNKRQPLNVAYLYVTPGNDKIQILHTVMDTSDPNTMVGFKGLYTGTSHPTPIEIDPTWLTPRRVKVASKTATNNAPDHNTLLPPSLEELLVAPLCPCPIDLLPLLYAEEDDTSTPLEVYQALPHMGLRVKKAFKKDHQKVWTYLRAAATLGPNNDSMMALQTTPQQQNIPWDTPAFDMLMRAFYGEIRDDIQVHTAPYPLPQTFAPTFKWPQPAQTTPPKKRKRSKLDKALARKQKEKQAKANATPTPPNPTRQPTLQALWTKGAHTTQTTTGNHALVTQTTGPHMAATTTTTGPHMAATTTTTGPHMAAQGPHMAATTGPHMATTPTTGHTTTGPHMATPPTTGQQATATQPGQQTTGATTTTTPQPEQPDMEGQIPKRRRTLEEQAQRAAHTRKTFYQNETTEKETETQRHACRQK